jgi:hypothetical protein
VDDVVHVHTRVGLAPAKHRKLQHACSARIAHDA